MRSILLTALLLFTPLSLACQAPDFRGSYSMTNAEGGQVLITLQSAGAGTYSGTMSNGGLTWQLQGEPYEDALTGTVDTGQGILAFEAYVDDNGLEFILVEVGPDGMPDVDNGQAFVFARTGGAPQAGTQQAGAAQPGGYDMQQPNQPPNPVQPSPAPGTASDSPLAQQWRQVIAGKKVTYISSYNSNSLGGGGMSTKIVYHICSNGQFAYSEDGSVTLNTPGSPDLGTPGTADGGSGSWRIITEGQLAGVELRFNSGEVVVYRLDMQDGAVYANGDRVYVTPGEACN